MFIGLHEIFVKLYVKNRKGVRNETTEYILTCTQCVYIYSYTGSQGSIPMFTNGGEGHLSQMSHLGCLSTV